MMKLAHRPKMYRAVGLSACLLLAACGDREATSDSAKTLVGAGTPVPVAAETQAVTTQSKDAADDPEIWVDPADHTRGLIFGTDKQAGLYVYDLNGKQVAFFADGRLNNVDLRADFPTPQGTRVLVAASDRVRKGAALYLLDPATLQVAPWDLLKMDLAEPYGLCVGRRGDDFLVLMNDQNGQARQVKVAAGPDGKLVGTPERSFAIPSQPEGCVFDDIAGRLYIGEEDKGVWRYDMAATSPAQGTLILPAPSKELQPDVEGITLLREGPITWLIVSSQGDSAFAVWRVDGDAPEYHGRFSPVAANGVDGVTGTDGVAALGGAVGAYSEGLVVAQDDVDTDGEAASTNRVRQNFKLIDWREVKKALKLDTQPPAP